MINVMEKDYFYTQVDHLYKVYLKKIELKMVHLNKIMNFHFKVLLMNKKILKMVL